MINKNARLIGFSLILSLLNGVVLLSQETRHSYDENTDLYNIGKDYYDSENYELAISEFNKIINDDPYFFNAYFKKSYSYFQLENYELAIEEIDKAYKVKNINEKYFYMKGQFYDKLKQYDLAEYYLDMALNFKRGDMNYLNHRAAMHLDIGNYQKALNDFDIMLAEKPDMYNIYFGRGMAKYNLKMKKEACLDWLHAYDESESCKRYFFYKCTKENLDGIKQQKKTQIKFENPEFIFYDVPGFSRYISTKIKYPFSALRNQEQGMVIAKFTLTKDLNIENLKIIHSVSDSIDAEAKRMIYRSEQYWNKPARKNGIKVSVDVIVPISFIIEEGGINQEYLIDTLKQYLNTKEYQKLISLSSSILKSNPFLFDVYQMRRIAMDNLNQKDTLYSLQWYKDLRSFDGIFVNEIQSSDKSVKLYFNDLWELTDKSRAKYYRLAAWGNYDNYFSGPYADYTMDGSLYAEGEYQTKFRDGDLKMFFPNGNIKRELYFTKFGGKGIWKTYYENGNICNVMDVDGFNFNITEHYDSLGVSLITDGNGKFKHTYLNYLGTDTITIEGNYINHNKNGFWKVYINNELVAYDEYKNGKYLQGLYIDNGTSKKMTQANIGAWIFIAPETLRAEGLIEDKSMEKSYFWFLYRDKENSLDNSY